MNSLSDQQLLRDYAESRSEAAFTELVRRHVDLVHSAALRMVRDAHLAQDVTQASFVVLAENAHELTSHPILSGWLHRTAQNIATKTVRTDVRRRAREQEAAVMNEVLSDGSNASWDHIEPHLDEALGELNDSDRDALVSRYFQRKSAREMAELLGVSEAAAQKRVNRAVERLRELFSKRGISVGASGLVVILSANAVQSSPVELIAMISKAASFSGTAVPTSTAAAATKTIVMTTLQKSLITVTLMAAVGGGIYEARQASKLRDQLQTFQRQQTSLAEKLATLQTENESLSNQVARAKDPQALSKAQFEELLKLRGKSGLTQADSRELAKLRSTVAEQNGKIPDYLTNAMASGLEMAEKIKVQKGQAMLARMKKALTLTEDQVQAITNLIQTHAHKQTEMAMQSIGGKMTPEQRQTMVAEGGNQDEEIKALLTPAQLAGYPEFKQAEKSAAAEQNANNEADQIAKNFSLTKEQQGQIHAAFYQMNLNATATNSEAIAEAKRSGQLADAISMTIELEKSQLEAKVKMLADVLTAEQINSYRQEKMKGIDMMANAMKMLLPPKVAATTN